MMGKMMEEFFVELRAEDKLQIVQDIMPKVLEGCCASMNSREIFHMMHVLMPRMMEHCLAGVDPDEQQGMFDMCRSLLNQIEEKHLSQESHWEWGRIR